MNVNRSNERKWFHTLKKAKSRRYQTEIITDADYANDLVLLVYTPVIAESLQHRLEQAARGIVNSNKRVHMF